MTVDLTKAEIETLDQALVAWLEQPISLAQITSATLACLDNPSTTIKERFDKIVNDAKPNKKQRECAVILLRAKLIQAQKP